MDKGLLDVTWTAFTQGRGCRFCGREKMAKNRRLDYDFIESKFNKVGYELLSKTYKSNSQQLKYKCLRHPKRVQTTTYANLYSRGSACKECMKEKVSLAQKQITNRLTGKEHWNWKGGVTPLRKYLYTRLCDWFDYIRRECEYTCQITGKRNSGMEVHHLKSFNLILDETLTYLNLPVYSNVSNYSYKELDMIEEFCRDLHYKYGGVLLDRKVHREFHDIYGYGNNTPEQFYEFSKSKGCELNVKRVI